LSAHSSAGPDLRAALVAAVFLAALPWGAAAAQAPASPRAEQSASFRIALPADRPEAAASFGSGELVLDLPQGAQVPLDLQAVGGGLVLGVEARPSDGGGIRLLVRLGGSAVERVEVAGGFLTVRLVQRSRSGIGGPVAEGTYRIGVDDLIQIAVNGDPELTQQVVVGPSGTVMAPLVGEIKADGLTTGELVDRLTDLLARDYLVNPRVDVQVMDYRSKWVLVSGGVRAPGRVALRGRSDLKQAVADAGGFAESAGREIVISRKDAETGEAQRIVVDRDQFDAGVANLPVRHGDLVNVPEAEFCHVLGEVRLPQKIRVDRALTLFRALSDAGGLTEWANRKEIQILRTDGSVETYDLQKIQKGEAPDPPIRGGDRIYVKRRFL
jgi:polysaccharide export outer membrane protein